MSSSLLRRGGLLPLGLAAACGMGSGTTQASLKFRPYRFVSAEGEVVPAELGYLRVPENRSREGSRTIELAVLRFRGVTHHPGDPLVYLVGGPGSSAIESAGGPRFPAFQTLRAAGDVLVLEQRGTGRSRPSLTCPAGPGLPLDRPVTRAEQASQYRRAAQVCAEWWRSRGVDLAGYTVVESAADVEALRQALGVPRLALWGVSYGTQLALTIMRRYPERVSRAILAGVVGPDDAWPLPSSIDRRLEPLARAGLVDRLRSVVAELEARPVTIQVPVAKPGARAGDSVSLVIGGQDFLGVVAGALLDSAQAARVPALVEAAAHGDLSATAPAVLRARSPRSLGSAMANTTSCASGMSAARRERIAHEASTSLLAAGGNVAEAACDVWGVPDVGEEFRRPLRSDIPTLLISGTRDLITPPEIAAAVLAGLSRGEQILLDGAPHGHALVVGSPELARWMVAFLEGHPVPGHRLTVRGL